MQTTHTYFLVSSVYTGTNSGYLVGGENRYPLSIPYRLILNDQHTPDIPHWFYMLLVPVSVR